MKESYEEIKLQRIEAETQADGEAYKTWVYEESKVKFKMVDKSSLDILKTPYGQLIARPLLQRSWRFIQSLPRKNFTVTDQKIQGLDHQVFRKVLIKGRA